MKWKIVTVGKPALAFARAGTEEYLGRLQRYTDAEIVAVKAGRPGEEASRLLRASEGCFRLGFDERGALWDTAGFREKIERLEGEGVRITACLIGGAGGLGDAVRAKCGQLVALGRMTLQHELALVVVLEQLYRIHTLRRGEPYHR